MPFPATGCREKCCGNSWEEAAIFLVNGQHQEPGVALADGDQVAVFPPGGRRLTLGPCLACGYLALIFVLRISGAEVEAKGGGQRKSQRKPETSRGRR